MEVLRLSGVPAVGVSSEIDKRLKNGGSQRERNIQECLANLPFVSFTPGAARALEIDFFFFVLTGLSAIKHASQAREIMEQSVVVYKRAPDVVAASMGEIALLLHVNDWVYLELNESGSRIWELLEDGRGVPQLVSALVKEFAIDPEDCAEDTTDFLSMLESKKFVVRM